MNLFLAPLQGMTTACYRNAFAKIFGGFDGYYAPFIATTDMTKFSPLLLKDLLPERNNVIEKIIPQLLGNNGTDFRFYASAIADLGYNEVNWNIGCPYRMVTRKRKGSGLLLYPDMIKKLLDIACTDSSYRITIKMRLGFKEPEDGMQVMKVLNEYPLGGVIIHARTGIQMYTGNVDLDSFEALTSACKHEVTYNGDIFTYADFLDISSRFPLIKNYMLGRGALRDPFLPSVIKGQTIPSHDKINMIKNLHDEVYHYYKNTVSGEMYLWGKMKAFWLYMSVHTDKDGTLLKKVTQCQNAADYWEAINPILNDSSRWNDTPIL